MSEPSFASLSIFFPMWNEEDYINRAFDSAQEVCELLVEARRNWRIRADRRQ
jgi:hypothetical protein